jgi:hypothetical protein
MPTRTVDPQFYALAASLLEDRTEIIPSKDHITAVAIAMQRAAEEEIKDIAHQHDIPLSPHDLPF